MSVIRKIQIAWARRKLLALSRDVVRARHDTRHYMNELNREIRRAEMRLNTLVIEERNSEQTKEK